MLIDYIYLIIIFVLIAGIIFFIYLSYEYRNNDTSKGIGSYESFINPTIGQLQAINTAIPNKLNNFLLNYSNFNTQSINNQIRINNDDYLELLKLGNNNKKNAEIIANEVSYIKLPKENFPNDKLIRTIKSNYNSQFISVHPNNKILPDTNTNLSSLGDVNYYSVLVNDKCLTVNGLCDPNDKFCLLNCQDNLYSSDSQQFTTKRINNPQEAAQFMNKYTGRSYRTDKINKKNIYPFNIFQSSSNNHCLTINNDGVTVEPCNVNNIHQQWQISPDENICLFK